VFFNSNPSAKKISHYFSFMMVAIYIALGLLFLFTAIANETFPVYRTEVGCLMLVYAGYRSYSTYKKIKQNE